MLSDAGIKIHLLVRLFFSIDAIFQILSCSFVYENDFYPCRFNTHLCFVAMGHMVLLPPLLVFLFYFEQIVCLLLALDIFPLSILLSYLAIDWDRRASLQDQSLMNQLHSSRHEAVNKQYEGKESVITAVAVGCINNYKEPIKNNENWCKLVRERVTR